MFVSSAYLSMKYGVDDKISAFFVDREPPVDNLYWHGKLLYLRPSPGYLFIPLIVDLLFKLGIDKQQLLSEEFVQTMEQIGHISALEETGKITQAESVEQCASLTRESCKSNEWYNNLVKYFNNEQPNLFSPLATSVKALHRGDVFLFSVCKLNFPAEKTPEIIKQWFALITILLLQDDIEDYIIDEESGEENAILESGLNRESMARLLNLVRVNLNTISAVNKSMALALDVKFKELIENHPVLKNLIF